MEHFWTVAQQVLVLFILIAVGFVCGKVGILREKAISTLADLALYIATPCVIIQSFLREFDPAMLGSLFFVLLASIGIHLVGILIARLCLRRGEDDRRRVAQFAVVFSNAGYMCLPLQQAVLGATGVFYGSVYVAVFNLVLWSYGFLSMRQDAGERLSARKLLLNPGLIGVVVGLLLFLGSVQLPTILREPIEHLASLNTPVPMLIIGYYLSQSRLSDAVRDKEIYLPICLRLLAVPAVSLVGMWICGMRDVPLYACVIAASAPVAAATTMFATKFGRDTTLSVHLVSISTLLSVLTMPAFVLLTQWVVG